MELKRESLRKLPNHIIYKYKVQDINHIEVQDKNDPSKTYKTDVSFIAWYPEESFDSKKYIKNGSTNISNITAFMTNNEDKIIQKPFFSDGFGYILSEFSTDGIFIEDSLSRFVSTKPGTRIKEALADKGIKKNTEVSTLKENNQNNQHHYEQNPYNLILKQQPINKLVEKTLRYYYKYNDENIRERIKQMPITYQKTCSSQYNASPQYGHLLVTGDNVISMAHNDICCVEKSKISNIVVSNDSVFNDKQAMDIVHTCRDICGSNFLYLLDRDRKIKKISFETFLKRNLVNQAWRVGNTKNNMNKKEYEEFCVNTFNDEKTKQHFKQKIMFEQYDLCQKDKQYGNIPDSILNDFDNLLKCGLEERIDKIKTLLTQSYEEDNKKLKKQMTDRNLEQNNKVLFDHLSNCLDGKESLIRTDICKMTQARLSFAAFSNTMKKNNCKDDIAKLIASSMEKAKEYIENYYQIILKEKMNSKKNRTNKKPNWNKYTAKRHNNKDITKKYLENQDIKQYLQNGKKKSIFTKNMFSNLYNIYSKNKYKKF